MSLIVNGTEITDLFVIDRQGNRVEIETLQDQLGNILFQKSSAPAWFNYTGIDASGNIEGTTAYDGVAIAYGVGKPQLSDDGAGTITVGSWGYANGLNDEYFTEKYGDAYNKYLIIEEDFIKVVEDILVIPDTYRGKPITTIFDDAFTCNTQSSSNARTYQPAFYNGIAFGANITTIRDYAFRGMRKSTRINGVSYGVKELNLPTTLQFLSEIPAGASSTTSDYTGKPILKINSNTGTWGTVSKGISNTFLYTVYGENVTQVNNMVASGTVATTRNYVFKQPPSVVVSFTFTSKPKTAFAINIYTDNTSVQSYDWSTNANVTPTFYPLSSYVEG